jgi:hypothetical protein
MPGSLRIINDLNLCLVRFWGHLEMVQVLAMHQAYRADADYRPGHWHLIDMAGIDSVDQDFLTMLRMQAEMVDTLLESPGEVLAAYVAPTPISQSAADLAARGWRQTAAVMTRIVETEAEACAILGLRQRSIAELLTEAT